MKAKQGDGGARKRTARHLTGGELSGIRKRLGLSMVEFGRVLGYTGSRNAVQVAVARYENGHRPIPAWIGRLAVMYAQHGVPQNYRVAAARTDQQQ